MDAFKDNFNCNKTVAAATTSAVAGSPASGLMSRWSVNAYLVSGSGEAECVSVVVIALDEVV